LKGTKKVSSKLILISVFLAMFLSMDIRANAQAQTRQQSEIQTQNQGEIQQMQIETQEREEAQIEQPIGPTKKAPSEKAREQMSVVAQEVEQLLVSPERMGGIGEQVREVARVQNQAQEQIQLHLIKIETRSGFLKRIIGPDYKAVRNLEQIMAQNQERIRSLEQLQTQVANRADQTQIQETVQAMVEQNNALQERLEAESQIRSLFGWLFRLFNR
jgi:hypothetical protein